MPAPSVGNARSSQDAALSAACRAFTACSSRSATTPMKSPSCTTASTPGSARIAFGVEGAQLRADHRRANDASEKHSRQLHVVHEARRAGDFGGDVEARRARADHPKLS